jgi:plastocyanin
VGHRVVMLSLVLLVTSLMGSCGGAPEERSSASEAAQEPTPVETILPSLPDTVPLEEAKKGDLIGLPGYPLVGMYTTTKDVSGLGKLELSFPLVKRVRAFSPSVLIGTAGQQVEVTVLPDGTEYVPGSAFHDFRVADGPDFSSDHEVLGEQWKANKGTKFTLTFPAEGSVAFYCSYHLRINMAGMLVVK